MGKQRLGSTSKTRYRNLVQYRDMTDDEFEEMWAKKQVGIVSSKEWEDRIERKIEKFSEDYDIDDMKANDMMALRALAQALITLEDYESAFAQLRAEHGINLDKVIEYKQINEAMSLLRRDITNLQNDLGITRKARKGDKETSVISELERLKQAAKEFYEEKMFYIFCPNCKMLLATIWFNDPNHKKNAIRLVCTRPLENDIICGTEVTVTSKDLLANRGVNIADVPEFFR